MVGIFGWGGERVSYCRNGIDHVFYSAVEHKGLTAGNWNVNSHFAFFDDSTLTLVLSPQLPFCTVLRACPQTFPHRYYSFLSCSMWLRAYLSRSLSTVLSPFLLVFSGYLCALLYHTTPHLVLLLSAATTVVLMYIAFLTVFSPLSSATPSPFFWGTVLYLALQLRTHVP